MNYLVIKNIKTGKVEIKEDIYKVSADEQIVVAKNVDGAMEKHLPIIEVKENEVTIRVSDVMHPSLENHYIEFIAIKKNTGLDIKRLKWSDTPVVSFKLKGDEKVLEAIAYCNIHGLWVTKKED